MDICLSCAHIFHHMHNSQFYCTVKVRSYSALFSVRCGELSQITTGLEKLVIWEPHFQEMFVIWMGTLLFWKKKYISNYGKSLFVVREICISREINTLLHTSIGFTLNTKPFCFTKFTEFDQFLNQ